MAEDDINRGTVVINDIEASSRDEMRCPQCGKKSIEEHPSASEYPTKDAAILKGSYCTNPDCGKGILSPREVEKQYEPQGIVQQLTNPKTLLQLGIAIVGLVLIGSYFLGGPIHDAVFATPTATIDGTVVNSDGNPVSNATVSINGSETTTNAEGRYTLEEIEVGEYMLSIVPPDDSDMRSFGAQIEVSQNGASIIGETVPSRLYSTEEGFQTQLPSGITLSDSFKSQNSSRTITYLHENNRENITVTVDPLEQSEIQSTSTNTIQIGEDGTLNMQGSIISSTAFATGITVEETYTQGKTTDSSGQSVLNVRGTMTPTSAQIELGEGAGTSDREQILNLASGGEQTINVNGNVLDMNAVIRGGATDAPQQRNDIWSPEDGPIELTIQESDAPSTTTLTFTGDIDTESGQTSGSLSSQSEDISITPEGSLSPSNAEISFSGGNIESEVVGSGELNGSGEGGTEDLSTELKTVENDGTYSFNYDLSATQNSQYVLGGYTINGERTEISGSGAESLSLSQGDTVGMWLTLQQEQVETADHTDNSSIQITDIQTNIDSENNTVAICPTLENTGSSETTDLVYYVDGTEVHRQESVDGDISSCTNEITYTTESLSEGAHTIQVNEYTKTINIGSGGLEYGEGSISGELSYVADQGQIQVDSNNDNSPECTVVASGGTCDINLSQGENTISLTQQNVSGVNWEVSYTARYGAEDIRADMTGDGTYEIDHSGVLSDGETVSASVTLPAGTREIEVTTGNGESVPYNLEWTESGVIDSPTLYVNGQEVANVNESYQGQREFNINGDYFESGENTIRLETEDNAEHTVILDWSERGLDTYPTVSLADSDVQLCNSRDFSGGGACEIDPTKLSPGTQSVEFIKDGSPVSEANFDFTHTARAVPSSITLSNTETDEEIVFTKSNAQEEDVDGSWTHERSVDIENGNTYEVTTSTSSQLDLDGSVTIEATAEREQAINPQIVIVHPDGTEETVSVPDSSLNSDGELTDSATITINSDRFARGQNEVRFISENDGVYTVEIVGVVDASGEN